MAGLSQWGGERESGRIGPDGLAEKKKLWGIGQRVAFVLGKHKSGRGWTWGQIGSIMMVANGGPRS